MKPREGEHALVWCTLGLEKKNGAPQTGRRSYTNYIPGCPRALVPTNRMQNLVVGELSVIHPQGLLIDVGNLGQFDSDYQTICWGWFCVGP